MKHMDDTTSIRQRVAALFRKDSPTGSAVHVPAPMGNDDEKKKKRRRAIAGALKPWTGDGAVEKDAPASAQYIGRMVLNADQLAAWWAGVARPGEPQQLDPNPHITVAFSQSTFPWDIDRSLVVIPVDQFDGLGLLGPKNALVLFLKSPLLESRWQAARDAGASWDYDGYRPHVTLCYLGAGYTLNHFRDMAGAQPDFPIILGQELQSTGAVDVYEAVQAPEWYQNARGIQKHQPVHVTVNVAPPAVTVAPPPAPHVNVTVEAAPQPGRRIGKVVTNTAGERVVEITDEPLAPIGVAPTS